MTNAIKKTYKGFCRFEDWISAILLSGIVGLVFISAVMRFIGFPLVWATDMATFAFAWEVFIGGDIAIRSTEMVGVELIANALPAKIQKALKLFWFVLITGFCIFLVIYGTDLCLSNIKRTFASLAISYSWCSLSVPVGSFFMAISSVRKIVEIAKTPASNWNKNKVKAVKKEEK